MRKLFNVSLVILSSLAGLLVLVITVSAILYSPEYVYRTIANRESKITDYLIFPERIIAKSASPYSYIYELDAMIGAMNIEYTTTKGETIRKALLNTLEGNGTTSFIVVKDDMVVYEEYMNGSTKDSINTSFSSVKSLVSLMIGMAIEDGYIDSVYQEISVFLPELADTDFGTITIENLLMMRSNIKYQEGFLWFTDDAKTYYMPDLRNLALNHLRTDAHYSGQFHYNNYHPLLLGIILERSTGQHVADYFQKRIWEKIGAESDASWSLDSEASGFEKMESGLNFKAIDFAKIGSMVLHNGKWNGHELISTEWVALSTITVPLTLSELENYSLKDIDVGYKYMWYSTKNAKGGHDFYAAGKYGQYIYISPENNTVIVRTGSSAGGVHWWPDIFKQVASNLDPQHVGARR